MEAKSFRDSQKNVVKIGDRVALLNLAGVQFDKGTVERIEKKGSFITVFTKERPRYRFFPESLRKLEDGREETE